MPPPEGNQGELLQKQAPKVFGGVGAFAALTAAAFVPAVAPQRQTLSPALQH